MNFKKVCPLALSGVLLSSSALAGGFQLSEYSTTNLGRSFAGAGIVGDDYSAIAFNPAGMALNDTGIQLGGNLIKMTARAEGNLNGVSGPDGKIDVLKLVPHLFAQTKVGEDFRVGMGVYVPFGFGTDYNDDWFGKTQALLSEITAIDVALATSYNITNTFSVGASVFGEYTEARLTNATASGFISDLSATNTDIGYTLGFMYRPDENTRFGLSYRSATKHHLKGDHTMGYLKGDVDAELDFPEHILFTAYHKVNDFGLSGSVKWTKWSRFESLNIYSNIVIGNRRLIQSVEEDWKNTWTFAAGVDYYINDKFTLRAGLSYDQAGIKNDEHRTARVPDNDRIIASIGASYMYENWQVDLGYAHMFMSDTEANHTITGSGTLNADYSSQVNLLGLSVQYNF